MTSFGGSPSGGSVVVVAMRTRFPGSSSQIADLDIATVGDTAHGVFLQSIGGGGGAGGSVTSGAAGGDLSANFSFGATGGDGGSAGDVQFFADGEFSTLGDGSHAIFLQSVGGGGGYGGSVTSDASSDATSADADSHLGPLLLTLVTVVLAVAQAMSPVPSPESSSPKAMAPLA